MKRVFLAILCTLQLLPVIAQVQLPAKCEAFLPTRFANALVLKESIIEKVLQNGKYGQSNRPADCKYWVAYSDRSKNYTYESPNYNSRKYKELSFNERVYIAQIKGEWALVYNEPKVETYPRISPKAESKGWIPMSNLLLWNTAMANEAGIYRKALIVFNIDKKMSDDLGKLYSNPASRTEGGKLKSDMSYYFIIKKDKSTGLVLIAKQSKINGVDAMLYGWVNENTFVPWNQRSCLEPTWDNADVEALKGNPVRIYPDSRMSKHIGYYEYGKKSSKDEVDMYRMPAGALRFPILDNDSRNNNIYKCTAFGNIGGSLGVAMQNQDEINRRKDELLKKISKVNLILVIDGTASMEKYYPAVKKAIRECKYFKEDYKFKVGLVIYRDYTDGEGLVEYLPIRDFNDAKLMSYLDNGGTYGIKSSPRDHTHAEALYKGLETALDRDKMGYGKDENNIMVVIGDCGNDENDTKSLTSDQIVSKLEENNMQLMSFQVRNLNQNAFLMFNDQMVDLILQNMKKQYSKLYKGVKVRFKEINGGYDLKLNAENQYRIGSMRYADANSDMNPSRLTSLLDVQFGKYAEMLTNQVQLMAQLEDVVKRTGNFAINTDTRDDIETALDSAEIVKRIGLKYYNQIKNSNSMVAYTGYTKKMDDGDRNYWKPVVFISVEEYNELMSRLISVYNVAKTGKLDRAPYVAAMKGILRSLVPDITDEEMDKRGVDEVMRMVNGLNESTNALKGYTLLEIQSKETVSDAKYRQLLSNFKQKFERLQKIKNDYQFKIRLNNTTYYWLPMEDMP